MGVDSHSWHWEQVRPRASKLTNQEGVRSGWRKEPQEPGGQAAVLLGARRRSSSFFPSMLHSRLYLHTLVRNLQDASSRKALQA